MKIRKTIFTGAVVVAITVLLLSVMIEAGNLEPSGAPAPTMKTLDEIPPTWSQILPASERFELVLGGAGVLDKETGLVWEQSPSTATYTWPSAMNICYSLTKGNRKGWHLPTVAQLSSLIDTTLSDPAIPTGHPFSNVQVNAYWSATTSNIATAAWTIHFLNGSMAGYDKAGYSFHGWCVRGGQSHDAY